MGIREIKRKMRTDLHLRMRVLCLYIQPNGETKPLHVRVHSKFDATSIDAATNNGTMPSRQIIIPKLLFFRAELAEQAVVLRKNAIISVEPGEAYRLDNAEPVDDLSVSWFVTQLALADTVDLPVPENG